MRDGRPAQQHQASGFGLGGQGRGHREIAWRRRAHPQAPPGYTRFGIPRSTW